jgi:hypothetical protein
MEHLSINRLKELLNTRTESPNQEGYLLVYISAKELVTMARVCLFHHPDNFMAGHKPTEWPEKPIDALVLETPSANPFSYLVENPLPDAATGQGKQADNPIGQRP